MLTHRERQVVSLAAEGLRDAEIADELGLSVNTVKQYVKRALRGLGARNRTHAVAIFVRANG